MHFNLTPLPDTWLIDVELHRDHRGEFARVMCVDEMRQQGIDFRPVQSNISFNYHEHTLRGMHFQRAPHAEAKLVRVTHGAIYDVVVDLRPDSPTYTQWYGVELTAENRRTLYIPEGFAHGFQTLADNTEVFYQMSEFYHPESADGVRWNDLAFGIEWPAADARIMSDADRTRPDFAP